MNAIQKPDWISPAEYLAAELRAQHKSEYLGGVVYAMAGANNRHNRIATNVTTAFGLALRGRRCEAFNSDTKVRIQLPAHVRFYYPDAIVVCDRNPDVESYQDAPAVIVEVLSRRTRRLDEGEKREAYLTLPSVRVYLLVEQEFRRVVAWRRTDRGFVREVFEGAENSIPLPEVEVELPLADLYERVTFEPEEEEEEV